MENYAFKSVAFGGFDKQDVIHYIEQTAKGGRRRPGEAAEGERGPADRGGQPADPGPGAADAAGDGDRPPGAGPVRAGAGAHSPAGGWRHSSRRLNGWPLSWERLRPEAEAYAQFRDRVGDIECDAHKRAAELEASTTARLRRTVELFRAQYVTLMSSFESTASHVTAELRKVEVNLSQLPRAMDQAGTELNELAALLDRSTKKEEKEPRG